MADSSSVVSSEVQSPFTNGDGESLEEKDSIGDDVPVGVIPRKSSVLKKDGKSTKRALQKSVSFIARPEDKRIINGEIAWRICKRFQYLSCRFLGVMINCSPFTIAADCLTFMQNGSELMKIRSNSRQYQRFFFLDEDLSSLRWRPSSKKPDKARSKWSCVVFYEFISSFCLCILAVMLCSVLCFDLQWIMCYRSDFAGYALQLCSLLSSIL